ncbi:hypothetical protein PVK06_021302 [Gossypium arboreum]|uniref:Uncharacterized protein n=1 Tax=Gossypium arboreum TaxID=29729 RepID=A0ABR0PPM5_GOSAR|nr:hypothetical protein PVK06_021302 [Gossypium arboreum]
MHASDKTGGKAFGAFTYTVLKVIKESNGAFTNRQLVLKARSEILNLGFENHHPCLYCSDENADAAFLGHHPNTTTGCLAFIIVSVCVFAYDHRMPVCIKAFKLI